MDVLAQTFKLTSEEKKRLSQFPVGQGLFFAGSNHVHMQIVASPTETNLITTNPNEKRPPAKTEQVDLNQTGYNNTVELKQ